MNGLCGCGCGRETSVIACNNAGKGMVKGQHRRFVNGHQSRTHGLSKTRTYQVWNAMIGRCSLPRHPVFVDYGARGISVCAPWQSFEGFLADMGEAPPGLELDRIDNNGNYSPENCRWATRTQQMRNTRRVHLVIVEGETMSLTEACERYGKNRDAISSRIRAGWDAGEALTTPTRTRRRSCTGNSCSPAPSSVPRTCTEKTSR